MSIRTSRLDDAGVTSAAKTTVVQRYDLVRALGEQSGARVDEKGFLHAPVRVTRSGIFEYRMPDGSISRELKHPEDIFNAESIESAKRLVATSGHPKDGRGRPIDVTIDNVKRLQVGHLGDTISRESVLDEDHLVMDVTITDKQTVSRVLGRDGGDPRPMVSPGFTAVLIDEPGEWNGQPYDRRQTEIRYNHFAVDIDQARGGFTVAMKLDENEGVQSEPPTTTKEPQRRADAMLVTLRIDETTTVEIDANLHPIIASAFVRRDEKIAKLEADAKSHADELKSAKNLASTEKARADAAEKDKADAAKRADAAEEKIKATKAADFKSVHAVVSTAQLVLKHDELEPAKRKAKLDELLALEGEDLAAAVRKHTVLTVCKDEADAINGEDDSYFRARFDHLAKSLNTATSDATKDAGSKLAGATGAPTNDWRKDAQSKIDEAL